MTERKRRPSFPFSWPRSITVITLVLLLACVVGSIWIAQKTVVGPARTTSTLSSSAGAPDATSPYENTRPGVGYVGDAACARCHRDIASAYRSHPMGRSLAPVSARKDPPATADLGLPIEDKGVRYTIETRDGRVFHKAARHDPDGHAFAEISAEVQFALGSGTRGVSYLIDRDGFLFQSPIAWFAQTGRWDISPGYGEYQTRPDFERPIQPDCLYCHANHFNAVAGTLNRYEEPIFQGHAIGCERCHGPGSLHVTRARTSAGPDMSIVNPAHLEPALRDSVCQQCHLQGSFRFARAGRTPFDYRPGLPLHQFLAVFLLKRGSSGKFEAVGHDEQMQASRCFAASKGELGCISCHDPHSVPAPATRVAYYRDRCLACHAKKGCALPAAVRQTRGQGDDCVACHMPRPAISNVPHTAATDHRIPRGPAGSTHENPRDTAGQSNGSPLVDYHWPLMTDVERQAAERDIGVAQGWAARSLSGTPQVARFAAIQGLPVLEAAVQDRPDDLVAREFLGHAFESLNRHEDALHAFEDVLGVQPQRELALRATGRLLTRLNRPELARTQFQKAIAVNPWISFYRMGLARACHRAGTGRLPLQRVAMLCDSTLSFSTRACYWLSVISVRKRLTRPTPSLRFSCAFIRQAATSGINGTTNKSRRLKAPTRLPLDRIADFAIGRIQPDRAFAIDGRSRMVKMWHRPGHCQECLIIPMNEHPEIQSTDSAGSKGDIPHHSTARPGRVTPATILMLALWVGLVAGFLDMGLLVFNRRVLDRDFIRLGSNYPWIIPLCVAALMAVPGAVLAVIARMARRSDQPESAVLAFLFSRIARHLRQASPRAVGRAFDMRRARHASGSHVANSQRKVSADSRAVDPRTRRPAGDHHARDDRRASVVGTSAGDVGPARGSRRCTQRRAHRLGHGAARAI